MEYTKDQQTQHEMVMRAICQTFREKNLPMVLKGGTALKLCYGLDRFSEDLDFDSTKQLNIDTTLNEIFTQLGKGSEHLRNPSITLKKDTKTVRRYRVTYGDNIYLKIETSLRDTPDDNDIVEVNGILTYKIEELIRQKLRALAGRTAARDLHDVIFLFDNFYDQFGEDETEAVIDLYNSQSEVMDRFNAAYEEDSILTATDLIQNLMKLIELVEEHLKSD